MNITRSLYLNFMISPLDWVEVLSTYLTQKAKKRNRRKGSRTKIVETNKVTQKAANKTKRHA